MTYTIDTEIRDQLGLKGAEVDVFFFLRSICRGEAVYHAGLSGLSSALNCSWISVQRAISSLKSKGLVIMVCVKGSHDSTYQVAEEYRISHISKRDVTPIKKICDDISKRDVTPIKNINIDNNTPLDEVCDNAHASEDDFFSLLERDNMWREAVCIQRHITMSELTTWLDTFKGECRIKAAYHKDGNDLKRHFCDWLSIQQEKGKNKKATDPEPISLDILMRDFSKK